MRSLYASAFSPFTPALVLAALGAVFLALCQLIWYSVFGATRNGRRLASPFPEGTSFPLQREGVVLMLTYSELFQFCLVVIGIIGLFFQATKKK